MERLPILSTEHLLLRIRMLNRAIGAAVERQRELNRMLAMSKAKGLYISDMHVRELLARVDAFVRRQDSNPPGDSGAEEALREQELRKQAVLERCLLPFDRLARIGLTRQEQDAVALCAAPELHRAYERLYAYILDDLTRRSPCVALLADLTCAGAIQSALGLHVFGPFGALRRRELLVAVGDASTEARQELRLGPGVLDFLLTARASPEAVFRDRAEMKVPTDAAVPLDVDAGRVRRMGDALREGTVTLVGVWGPDGGSVSATVRVLCSAAGLSARRLVAGDVLSSEKSPIEEVRKAFLACATLGSLLWVEVDELKGAAAALAVGTLTEQLVVSEVPVILSGRTPWRPHEALATRGYGELELEAPAYATRKAMWQAALPGLEVGHIGSLAARFRLETTQLAAATRVAGVSAALAGNGRPEPLNKHLEDACATVTRRASVAFARVTTPRRRAEDLVLPPLLHDQVLEIARFHKTWPRVAEEWGFSRLDPSVGALKALFTGDSGTGKTSAAEAIAGEIKAPLIKVDLARVVSKWVGDTEKNLASVFDEARTMHAVLFFDEVDALFGRRGDVQRGMDRYANLEVSYLLQRLEEHDSGIVILASNLRDNIDAAFTRRFQVTVHFPRPTQDLRRRLWRLALNSDAPVDGIDFDALARVDLTGGGIVGAARTAALLAADAGSPSIGMEHLVRGVARQFRREARLLNPAELGPFAHLLREA